MKPNPDKRYTIRTDSCGKKVKVPFGHSYKEGKSGKGIAYHPTSATKEDGFGDIQEIPAGHRAIENPDKTLTIVKYGEAPESKPPNPKKGADPPPFGGPAIPLSQREVLKLSELMARRVNKS